MHTHLQAAQSNRTVLSLQKSVLFSLTEKLKNKKFPSLQKNKTLQPYKPRQTVTNFYSGQHTIKYFRSSHGDTDDSSTGGNIGLPAMAGTVVNSAFVHLKSFVLGDRKVLLNRHCGKPKTVSKHAKT